MFKKHLKTLVLGGISAAMLPQVTIAADYNLVLPLVTGENSYNYKAASAFKNFVENNSAGQITVEIFPGGTFCSSARECFDALGAGNIDIFQSNFGDPSNIMTEFAVLDLPYMLRDDAVAECTFDDEDFMAKLRQGFLDASGNMRLMVISNSGGWRNIATTEKAVLTPNDVKGLKLRTIPAEIQQELVRQLGGAPTGITWGEVYTSLATGVVEGTKNGITDIVTMNFQDHLKHITLDGHSYMGGTWFMNNDKFMEIPEDLRKIVVEGFDVLNQYLRSYPKYNDVASFQAFTEAGGTIHPLNAEQKAAFREATSGMEDWVLKQSPTSSEWLNLYKDAIQRCEKKVDNRLNSLIK